jgi:1-acyl-sn-glycerol-3-phosphate acyltransferase
MPRFVRSAISIVGFALFFAGSPFLGLVVFPLLWLFSKNDADHKRRITRLVNKAQWLFTEWMRFFGVLTAPRSLPLPPGVDPEKPYVLVANHPTLIDTVLLMGWRDEATCVAKGAWYRSFVLGPLLRQTNYLPSPRKDEGPESRGMLERMTEHLRAGHALLVFPEGTRSEPDHLHRFRRGAVEAAIAVGVPIVPVFVGVDRPFLMKGWKPWNAPKGKPRFIVEVMPAVDTTAPGADAKAINADLQARFQARFDRLLREERVDGPQALAA